jgi:hypothetical protein
MTTTISVERVRPLPLASPRIQSAAVTAWRQAHIRPVSTPSDRHTLHSYFNACPESPDGRHILFYTSTTPDAHIGQLRILERATGIERVLASKISTEDAHRAACQQWIGGGRAVAFHDFRAGRWVVAAIDLASGQERILADDRQIGFGTPRGLWAPIYGPHWKQGPHRDLELVNVETGEIRIALRIGDVRRDFGPQIVEMVGEGEISIFFPVLSPDGNRVMFKIARGSGGNDFRSAGASDRQGKFVYELATGKPLGFFESWGHPSWLPNSSDLFEKGQIHLDLRSGTMRCVSEGSPSDHPSVSPDGTLFVTDGNISKSADGKAGEWGIIVGAMESGEFATIHRFDHSGGARSWRKAHPHPVFSADGRRIYFNVSSGPWTRLHVAELPV